MEENIIRHVPQRQRSARKRFELLNELEGCIWEDFYDAAYLLNELGIQTCHLVATLKDMEADGLLKSCSQCNPAPALS
jgi:hypothetical protein